MEENIKHEKSPMTELVTILLKDDKIDIDTARIFLSKEKDAIKKAWMDKILDGTDEEKITGANLYVSETYGNNEYIGTPRSEAIDVLNDLYNAKGEDVDFLDEESTKAVAKVTIEKILFVLEKQIVQDFEDKDDYISFWREALDELDNI